MTFSVLSGIKQVNVELEPGFQSAQKRDSGKALATFTTASRFP